MPVFLLSESLIFPHPRHATKEGLLAVGGDLSQNRLLLAYSRGIFPWFSDNEPIMWWSPDPRLVLFPEEFRASRTLRRLIRKQVFRVTVDQAFNQVIAECARIRTENSEPTWIVTDMIEAYGALHESGYAHSVEVWRQDTLVGGLYGVSLGRCFFGESMFAREKNASKVAFAWLVHYLRSKSIGLIDCQVTTAHLISLGAREIPRDRFLTLLHEALQAPTLKGRWSPDDG